MGGQEQDESATRYKVPSERLRRVIDAEAEPSVLLDPTGRWAVVLRHRALPLRIEDISRDVVETGGLCFDPQLRVPDKTVFAESVHVQRVFSGDGPAGAEGEPVAEPEVLVKGLEGYTGFRYFAWHPSGNYFAFAARRGVGENERLDLMLVRLDVDQPGPQQDIVATAVVADRTLNAVMTRPFSFVGDGSALLCHLVPENLGPAPIKPTVPAGPNVKENLSNKKKPARTYQRLIRSEHDEKMFEYFTRSELVALTIDPNDGTVRRNSLAGAKGGEMVRTTSLSPDKRFLVVYLTEKPFSWTLTHHRFPKSVQVWELSRPLCKYPAPSAHEKALSKHPAYPDRAPVSALRFDDDDDASKEAYAPVEFTHKVVFENDCTKKEGGWADPPAEALAATELESRFSYHGQVFLSHGRPQNPVGRTGMTGRGLLGKWGPNHAADAIVTRTHKGKLQMVAIQRKDTGAWAIPGGMVDPGESVPVAMKREFLEEAGNLNLGPDEAAKHEKRVDELFAQGHEIYRGYVDDPRNTDNAWMESSFVHFHCDDELGESLPLEAGDDAGAVRWLDVDENVPEFRDLYASHKAMVLRAAERLRTGRDSAAEVPVTVVDRKTVVSLPDGEGIVISFDATQAGPRDIRWHWQKPHTLTFRFALDGGDPNAPARNGMRDSLHLLRKPFTLNGLGYPGDNPLVTPVIEMAHRVSSVAWARAGTGLGIVKDRWEKTKRTTTWIVHESAPGVFSRKLMYDRSFADVYSSPGVMISCVDTNGMLRLQQDLAQGYFDVAGNGASPVGSRPFYDRLWIDAKGGDISFRTERMWRCALAPDAEETKVDPKSEVGGALPPAAKRRSVYEDTADVPEGGRWVLVQRESNEDPPNFFWHEVATGKELGITQFEHPQPDLRGVTRELVHYQRQDGLELNGDLFLPKGYDPASDGPRPCLLWAYPREFKQKKNAGQVKTSQHRFIRTSWGSPITWVAKDWVVLGFAAPIVGEGENTEPNDTFVEQLQLNALAAVQLLLDRGLGRVGGLAVGGHSYGAFMTAHLLAHTNFFNAGIARSGAYLRALTPFGFQMEERSYWDAQSTYNMLSPFSHVPRIAAGRGKLLLVHGMRDENSGTYPLQSERLYDALKGHGAVTRLVLLPNEGHGYKARESILHVLAEQEAWLDTHVDTSPTAPGAACEALPALPPVPLSGRAETNLAASAAAALSRVMVGVEGADRTVESAKTVLLVLGAALLVRAYFLPPSDNSRL